jgi:hypothetical protein
MLAGMTNRTTQHGTMEGVPLHLHIGNLDITPFHTIFAGRFVFLCPFS